MTIKPLVMSDEFFLMSLMYLVSVNEITVENIPQIIERLTTYYKEIDLTNATESFKNYIGLKVNNIENLNDKAFKKLMDKKQAATKRKAKKKI